MKAGRFGIISAILASACCLGPLLLVAIGLGGGAAFFGRYHWLFLIGGIGVLTWAWAKYLREKTVCDCEHKSMKGRNTALFTLLAATVIVLGFAGLNISRYVFPTGGAAQMSGASGQQRALAPGLQRASIPVEGMTCATCEISVRSALNRVNGVKSVQVSVATHSATVDFDPAQANADQLVSAINSTGYRASLPKQ